MQPQRLLFSDILKQNNKQHTHSLYIGLNLDGGNISELAIEGGEDPKDFHVTLLWGKFTPRSDMDDTVCRIQSVMEEIQSDIPERIILYYHERRFEASASSDGKDVIVAPVAGGIMEQLHKDTLKALKKHGITVEKTFSEYIPHMTLAYIDPDAEYELRALDHSAAVKDISVCIKKLDTKEKEYERKFIAKCFSQLMKFNPYHDRQGRFSASGTAASFTYKPGASTAHSKAIERAKAEADAGKGFKGTLYHGSPHKDIKEFDMKRAGENTSSGEKLLFFTDSKQMADDFSYERLEGSSKFFQQRGKKGRVYEVDVEMKNPLDFRKLSDKDIDNILKLDEEGILTKQIVQSYAKINHQLLKAGLTLTSDSLKNLGYDGLIANTGKAGHNSLEYAVVDSKQAKIRKSLGAMTFEELFKFNPYHDRLGRFATAGGATSFTYKPGQGKMYDNAIAREKERVGRADAIMAATSKKVDYILSSGGITTDKENAAKQVKDLYQQTALNGGISWNNETQKVSIKRSSLESVKGVARDIMSKQEFKDASTEQEYKELHSYIKRTPVKISDYDKQNIPDWNDYRKQAFGNITVSRNGISVDSFYQELSGRYPHLFDGGKVSNPADQLQQINDTLRNLKPQTYRLSGKQLEDATNDFSLSLISGYVAGMTLAAS